MEPSEVENMEEELVKLANLEVLGKDEVGSVI